MKKLLIVLAFLYSYVTNAQPAIEGNKLLELIGKPLSDPLFTQLKAQENFYTNAWDSGLTIYISASNDTIKEIDLQNGKIKYGTKNERYGIYRKPIPLGLNWNMTASQINNFLGNPILRSESMNFSDYKKDEWGIRVFFENDKPVSVSFKRLAGTVTKNSPLVSKPPVSSPVTTTTQASWLIKLDNNDHAEVNWPALKEMILALPNLKKLTGNDSVDYIGEMNYSTPFKVEGFERSAIKRKKAKGQWYYEAFLKPGSDSNKVKDIFFALYDAIKKSIKDNTGDDFILASVAKKSISEMPVNWIAQWSLYTNYKTLPAGLPKIKIALMISGMKNAFTPGKSDYVFKIYIFENDLNFDFFTWDKPL